MKDQSKKGLFGLFVGFLFLLCVFFTMIGPAYKVTYEVIGTSKTAQVNIYEIIGKQGFGMSTTAFCLYIVALVGGIYVLVAGILGGAKEDGQTSLLTKIVCVIVILLTITITVLFFLQNLQYHDSIAAHSSLGIGSILSGAFSIVAVLGYGFYLISSKK